jgi:CDP-diacylglycerol--glycerol-3-phosphate 3-phosphatidyltransferase/cardiolipin synthase
MRRDGVQNHKRKTRIMSENSLRQKLDVRDLASWAGFFTLVRMPLAVLFPFVVGRHLGWALVVYAAGITTDVIDGIVARRTGTLSLTGAIADGAADKIFHFVVAVSMAAVGLMPAWWLGFWFVREIGQAAILAWLVVRGRFDPFHDRKATGLGKQVTIALSLAIVLALSRQPSLALVATVATGLLGLAAVVSYGRSELSR